MIRNLRQRGTGMANRSPLEPKPYRWRGTPDWDPAKVAFRQRTTRQSALITQAKRAERHAEFRRLREAGVDVATAAELCGVTARTGRAYEKARLGLGGRP